MDAHVAELTRQLTDLQQRLESTEQRLQAAGSSVRRSRLWGRATVVLTVCTLVGLVFLDTSPAAPPAGVPAASLAARVDALEAKTAAISVVGNDFIITGKNLHIEDGSGATDSDTGLGNLTIGYNASRVPFGYPDVRTGSHNLIVGDGNNYSSFGGIVVGAFNEISGAYAVVSAGFQNMATASLATVSGGCNNIASAPHATVSGGDGNEASGGSSSVSGGNFNTASVHGSSVSGGISNLANSQFSSVSGGVENEASGFYSSVSGGRGNEASGYYSSVSGGFERGVGDDFDWAAGSLFEDQ